jgi:uncharacterized protein YchJ
MLWADHCGIARADRRAAHAFTLHRVRDRGRRYLGDTWHPRTAPASIDLDDALEWRRLEIIGTTGAGPATIGATVEFRAHWRMRATGRRRAP